MSPRQSDVRSVRTWLGSTALCGERLVKARAADFSRQDAGGLIVFGLFMLTVMLMMGGMAVDLMRLEAERTRVQNTADRATLAAAALRQDLEPEDVVADYFAKAGLSDSLLGTSKDGGVNYRSVQANTRATVNSHFMQMVGFDSLTTLSSGTAEERIPKVEISLVLDISGSMRFSDSSGTPQVELLRPAAKEFIDTMLKSERRDLFSISIVPYAGGVNPGQLVFDALGGASSHAFSHCLELGSTHFNSSVFPTSGSIPQIPHFMYWDIASSYMDWGWCPNNDTSAIQYFSADAEELKKFVDDFRMHDGTGTHFGMWWALGLLDPANNWLTTQLVAAKEVDEKFAARPAPWDDSETLKVIVLMTDGNITDQFRPTDPSAEINHTQELLRQSSSTRKTLTNRTTNRNRFYQVCDRARANKVIVYAIAFNTSGDAVTEMRNCATTPYLFYNVQSFAISDAFRSIAGSIRDLRLVQ